jgi:hypothetical protein
MIRSRAKRALDAERALAPLPGLGDDILVNPLESRLAQRPDTDDRAVIRYLEVTHVRRSSRLNASIPACARRVELQLQFDDRIFGGRADQHPPPKGRGARSTADELAFSEFLGKAYKYLYRDFPGTQQIAA